MSDTICHHLLNVRTRKHTAVEYVKKRRWQSMSWSEYFDLVECIAGGIKDLGVEKGSRVAIISNTRVEWAATDMAVLGLGAVLIPIYQNSISSEISHILRDAEVTTLIIESKDAFNRFQQIKSDVPQVKNLIGIDFSNDDVIGWDNLLERGRRYREQKKNFFEQSCLDRELDELATIVYTSGTTGLPKGVCLHHEQIMSEISEVFKVIDIDHKDKSLCFLPFAHIFGRVEHWAHVFMGFTMAYAESVERVRDNLPKAKPTFLLAVPRIFEKIYTSIQTQAEASPLKSKIFKWAIQVGYKMSDYKTAKRIPPASLLLEYQVARKLVFDKLMKRLGGRLRFAVSGGAPLSPEISKFFHAANLLILEGYGLTETTAAVLVNTPYSYKFGTVGQPFGDVQIKLASDGELCVKSKKVMREYYNNPEATKEVFDEEGYFKTGDIAEVDSDGFVAITDRKKDLIKTAGGKYVAPQKLENLLKLNSFISNVLIHGDQKKYIVCLITLNTESVKDLAQQIQVSTHDVEELSRHPKVKDLIRDIIADVNSQLASYETIKNFAILSKDFTIEGGELTPSLKVKRKHLDKVHFDLIESLYGSRS